MNSGTTDQFVAGQEMPRSVSFQSTSLILTAWAATLLLSKLPLVIARDMLGTDIPWINYAWIGLAALLWAVTYVWQTLKPLRSYFLMMGAILLMAFWFDPLVKQSALWGNLLADQTALVILFGERVLLVAVAYYRAGNLWLPIAIHFGWNFLLGPVLGLSVSGQNLSDNPDLSALHGPSLFTGGTFGIEGSLIVTVTTILGIVLLLRWYPRHFTSITSERSSPKDWEYRHG